MTKKPTITCKVCGGEHSGTICTKFTSVRVLPAKPKALLPPPRHTKTRKAKA